MEVVTLPGNHLTIMREPNVARLAEMLRERIAAADLLQETHKQPHQGAQQHRHRGAQASAHSDIGQSVAAE